MLSSSYSKPVELRDNDTLHNMTFEVTPEKVAHAMLAADALGQKALADWSD